jgi:hypothetical protein
MAYSIPRLFVTVLLSILAATSIHAVCAQEARMALVIGNAAYPDAEAPLKEPVNNVRALTDELKRHGFEVDTGENLSKEAMRAALERFYGKINSGSTALLFFSGYGIQSDRQTYMIPTDAQIWTEPDVRRDGFGLDSVLVKMNSRGARVKIAILDASRINPFERRFRAVASGLAPVSVPRGTVVMYAAAPGAVVRDGDRQVFVSELIKEIRGTGEIEEAFNRTLIAVSRASQGEQVPWFSSSLLEEFSFTTSQRASSESTRLPDLLSSPPPPRLWAVRALIEPAEMPPREGVGYGLVAFTTRPLPHDIERYKSICEAYKATLVSVPELPPNTPPSEQMITYWPITNKNTAEAQRADCPYLASNYALRLGLDAIQDADKQNQRLASRRGPFLSAWAPSESRFVPDAVVLVLDLSDKDSQRSFTEVFQDWRQKITDNPEVWRRQNGFNIEMVRRIIRDTFDRYGDGVLRLISRS